ncbi:hypothetical protein MFLAVUS_001054 [Mucor flavus]|uniref:Uncharacterized protein n=1 Tax=Mucor flavus TaxID=439312 RepID=A0ABP9YLE3_9FUNG
MVRHHKYYVTNPPHMCIREVQLVNTPNSRGPSDHLITRADAWDEEQEVTEDHQPYQHEDDYDSQEETDYDTDDEDWVPEEGSSNPSEGLTLAPSFQPSLVRENDDVGTSNRTTVTTPARHNTRPSRNNR